jgi:hypothetical protein
MNAVAMVALKVLATALSVAVGVIGAGGWPGQHNGDNNINVAMPTLRA